MNNKQHSIDEADAAIPQDLSDDGTERTYRPTSPTAWQRTALHELVEVRGEYGRARFRIVGKDSDSALHEAERMYRNMWAEHHRQRIVELLRQQAMSQGEPFDAQTCEIPEIACQSKQHQRGKTDSQSVT